MHNTASNLYKPTITSILALVIVLVILTARVQTSKICLKFKQPHCTCQINIKFVQINNSLHKLILLNSPKSVLQQPPNIIVYPTHHACMYNAEQHIDNG
jgi:hypothetical protein